jgi:hypothetical protein
MKLDGIVVGPVKPMHAPLWAKKPIAGDIRLEITEAENGEHGVDEEDQLTAGAQDAGRFGDPRVRVAPDAGAVLGDCEVKRVVLKRRCLGVAKVERKVDSVFSLQAPRRL